MDPSAKTIGVSSWDFGASRRLTNEIFGGRPASPGGLSAARTFRNDACVGLRFDPSAVVTLRCASVPQ